MVRRNKELHIKTQNAGSKKKVYKHVGHPREWRSHLRSEGYDLDDPFIDDSEPVNSPRV